MQHSAEISLVSAQDFDHKARMTREILPDVTFMQRLAAAAAAETLPLFRSSAFVENKQDGGFDPVTAADRDAEAAIRALIEETYPDHGIIGEEHGAVRETASHVWIIDPIDGTRAFISGLPVWGTLVGLRVDGIATAGFMSQPFTGEFFVADGEKSMLLRGDDAAVRLSTRKHQSISDATISVSWRIAEMVLDIESAASAVSSTAAVIIVTVCACASMAWRMRSALA